ncbi:hypothetical protein QO010_003442 [Caulobacter ginsengisoli]|uniref:CENP-V/GFA domain-containing protein n=1 Tax=Caulobacter ginsengisoli TaxID=400775 RepID=A0ABU0IUF8_9CAUL|nr:GFA family protein [Caulobacter ginsengisoli]MDQ0465653.1 hypothetical protein [Caulobacter ginsengisoli]
MTVTLPAFPIHGGCACGAIRYEVSGAPIGVFACCCTDCQKLTGAAFSLAMPLLRERFALTRGEPATWARTAESGRVIPQRFCEDCGTRLFTEPPRGPQTVTLRPGTLDDTGWLVPAAAFWTSSAQGWTGFPEGTLLYEREPDDFMPVVQRWREMLA